MCIMPPAYGQKVQLVSKPSHLKYNTLTAQMILSWLSYTFMFQWPTMSSPLMTLHGFPWPFSTNPGLPIVVAYCLVFVLTSLRNVSQRWKVILSLCTPHVFSNVCIWALSSKHSNVTTLVLMIIVEYTTSWVIFKQFDINICNETPWLLNNTMIIKYTLCNAHLCYTAYVWFWILFHRKHMFCKLWIALCYVTWHPFSGH